MGEGPKGITDSLSGPFSWISSAGVNIANDGVVNIGRSMFSASACVPTSSENRPASTSVLAGITY